MGIVIIGGSPHAGSTELLLGKVKEGILSTGGEVEWVMLREQVFRGCCGWSQCFYENVCIYDDDFSALHRKMVQADGIVLGSPNYFNNVSGLMKDFMDRTNPYTRPPMYKGIPTVLVTVGGWSMDAVGKCEALLQEFCRIQQMPVHQSILVHADQEADVQKQPEKLRACFEGGVSLALLQKAQGAGSRAPAK